jgi:hypothetical protein
MMDRGLSGRNQNCGRGYVSTPNLPRPFSAATWISEEASSPSRRMVLDLNTTPATEAREMILPPREEEMDMKDI